MLVTCKELLLKSLIDQVMQTFELQIVIMNNFHPIGFMINFGAHLSNNNMSFWLRNEENSFFDYALLSDR